MSHPKAQVPLKVALNMYGSFLERYFVVLTILCNTRYYKMKHSPTNGTENENVICQPIADLHAYWITNEQAGSVDQSQCAT